VSPVAAIYILWGLWFVAWLGAAAFARRERGTLHGRLAALFHLSAAAAVLMLLMIVAPWPGIDLQYRLWDRSVPETLGWILLGLALVGFGFSGWASVHRIARLQHGAQHIDTGPYAIVRHPLYLGLIVAAVLTALVFGRPTSLTGAVLLTIALTAKAHLEERNAHGPNALAYRQRVPMLVPFWPMGERDEASRQA
jgi:protein-S-isoprenylcysteine O-methyltransferase Ste14